jgi:hypothetical protein
MDSLVRTNQSLLSATFIGVGSGLVTLAAIFVLVRLGYNYNSEKKLRIDDCE